MLFFESHARCIIKGNNKAARPWRQTWGAVPGEGTPPPPPSPSLAQRPQPTPPPPTNDDVGWTLPSLGKLERVLCHYTTGAAVCTTAAAFTTSGGGSGDGLCPLLTSFNKLSKPIRFLSMATWNRHTQHSSEWVSKVLHTHTGEGGGHLHHQRQKH